MRFCSIRLGADADHASPRFAKRTADGAERCDAVSDRADASK